MLKARFIFSTNSFNISHNRRFITLNKNNIILYKNNNNQQYYKLKKLIRIERKMLETEESSNILSPPETLRNLKVMDKTLFKKDIKLPCLELGSTNISKIMPVLKKYFIKMNNLKAIQLKTNNRNSEDTKENCDKIALLNPEVIKTWQSIAEVDRNILQSAGIHEDNFKIIDYTLDYENWKADELLRAIIPQHRDAVAGFSRIGHLIHLNLREHILEYKNLIGQILLDKVPGVKTVVNKLDRINNIYRNFEMEVLAGEKNMFVQLKQNNCKFEFDFSTVYFNTRLSTEHERIVKKLQSGDILYDIFAGVGPFAIPAAKKKCIVFANDLNPESYNWLNHNAKINKINLNYLKTFNKDGGDFIIQDVKNDLGNRFRNCETCNIHITMNLPAQAHEFLKYFVNLFKDSDIDSTKIINYPIVHLYCFAKGETPMDIAKNLVEANLENFNLKNNIIEIYLVRTVSNYKEMVRVSFMLTREILFGISEKKRPPASPDLTAIKKFCDGKEQETEAESKEEHLQSCGSEKS